jgi:hypothetical protein
MKTHLIIAASVILGIPLTATQETGANSTNEPIHDITTDNAEANSSKILNVDTDSNTETSSEAHSSVNILNVSSSVSEATTPDQQAQNTESGLTVRIEPIHSGKGTIDVSQIKLRAPFPAKPLAQAPPGWHFDASNNASLYRHDVEIAEGSKITLTIQPHVLVPDSDGRDVFSIAEPGYEGDLGYQQISTIGAIVANSVRQLDEDAQKIGVAIDDLQQLLISLPKPVEVAPVVSQDAQVEKSAPNRKR